MVICKNCLIDKNENEYYNNSNGKIRLDCKICFIQKRDKLWTCPTCELTIRKRNKIKHEKSLTHQKCISLNEPYYKNLQHQNLRKD